MKKPSFILYSVFSAACWVLSFALVILGIHFDSHPITLIAGELVVYGSFIMDKYHARLRDYADLEKKKFDLFFHRVTGSACSQEVSTDEV